MHMYTMEKYYSVIKRNGIMSFAEMWVELETIILREVGQKKKSKYCIILFTYEI